MLIVKIASVVPHLVKLHFVRVCNGTVDKLKVEQTRTEKIQFLYLKINYVGKSGSKSPLF